MERKKADDFDREVLDLFDQYIHGGISRRGFLDGAAKFAVGGMTAAGILEALNPRYVEARPSTNSEVAVPIIRADHVIGVITIESDEPLELWADGEKICTTPVCIEAVPGAVRVPLPADSPLVTAT